MTPPVGYHDFLSPIPQIYLKLGLSKNFAPCLAEIAQHEAAGQPIEVWFADEARIGQKNKITRR
jgi:hypothetical protein